MSTEENKARDKQAGIDKADANWINLKVFLDTIIGSVGDRHKLGPKRPGNEKDIWIGDKGSYRTTKETENRINRGIRSY